MNPKLAAMGIIITASGSDRGFSSGQTSMFAAILEPFSVEQIEAAANEHVTKFSGWPMSDDALKAFKAMLRKQPKPETAVKPWRGGWWGVDGSWGGDWSGCNHASLIWHYAMIGRYASRCGALKAEEFREMCLRRHVPSDVLTEALAAARVGDWALSRFMTRVKAKAVA